MFHVASQPIVTYPSIRLFPFELAKGKNIVWSIYLSDKTIKSIPSITITDLDTNTVTSGVNVKNYSSSGYGNFKTLLTYSPGKTQIIPGHEYEINIQGVYKYTFKLFKQDATNDTTNYATATKNIANKPTASLSNMTNVQSPLLLQNKILRAVIIPKSTTASNTNIIINTLTKKGWNQNFFIKQYALQNIATIN